MKKKKAKFTELRKELPHHLFIWPALIFTVIFSYIPMSGLIIAFKDYRILVGIFKSPWSGLTNFKNIFNDYFMPQTILNTLGISILGILAEYPIVLLFALFLNEIRNIVFKRVVQTVSYLPHFISWAIMAVILRAMFATSDGIISNFLFETDLLKNRLTILTSRSSFWGLAIFSSIWKELGWSAIVFLAVISGIDETLYEAAKVDGAGRFSRMWYITLPSLKGIIAIMLILSVSYIPHVGFEQAYFLGNNVNMERARTLSYYIFITGIQNARFSYAAAINLILATISAGLMVSANVVSRKLTGKGLY